MSASPDRPQQHFAQGVSNKKTRIKNAVDFACTLNQRLAKGAAESDPSPLLKDLESHVAYLFQCAQNTKRNDPRIETWADQGTELWNNCNRLKRELASAPGAGQLLKLAVLGRCLSFFLLALQWTAQANITQTVYLTKLALKTGRSCIDEGGVDLKFSGMVLTRATDFTNHLQAALKGVSEKEEIRECHGLIAEHFTTRTLLAAKQDRLDLAEHSYKQAGSIRDNLDPENAENMADLLFNIGKSQMTKGDFKMAEKWLRRASEVINGQSLERLSREAAELRLAISQALVTALLGVGGEDSIGKAQNIVNYMESEIGNAMVVSLLRLEIMQKTPADACDDTGHSTILMHMIRIFQPTEANFKLIVHHIQKLHIKSPGLACEILDEFIFTVGQSDIDEWVEKLIITRVWMAIKQRESIESIEAVHNTLSRLAKPLRAEATVAAQKLISARLEGIYSERNFEIAEKWCQVALHANFANSGPGNVAKLERKLLLCAVESNDMDKALSIIQELSDRTTSEPMTAYIIFKVALRTEDSQKAVESLQVISMAPSPQDYLSACIASSQQEGNMPMAIAAMRKLFENFDYKAPNPVHLPALLRCMIRLSHGLWEQKQSRADGIDAVQDLCDLFESVLLAVSKSPKDEHNNKLFTKDELDWLSRTAYNLGMKNTETWHLRQVVQILTSCIKLIGHYPNDISSEAAGDLAYKSLFCHFIIASALVGLARCGDHVEQQLQDYLILRKHVDSFDSQLLSMLGTMDSPSTHDMRQKLATMLCFDFEAAIYLRKYDDLGAIVRKAKECGNVATFQAMADCLLRSDAPGNILSPVMKLLINEIWELEEFDNKKLAKYTRCLFQATLAVDEERSLALLGETSSMVQESYESETPWPQDELEWMATTAYDHGIDCYSRNLDNEARKWIMNAIKLAHHGQDGGDLEKAMHQKFLTLRFETAEG